MHKYCHRFSAVKHFIKNKFDNNKTNVANSAESQKYWNEKNYSAFNDSTQTKINICDFL